ncbi:hypothetical protein [Mycobacterium sherrisii]|uniref:Uncharacterized protein n=1 Tax=Mycobacterium sherrisii TaxID=243061 RepID=A0A1E3SU74_9MYCO|nr:hypothetical protein [Mycobacterium sherrisii]MCV7029178.1 hypothetical protein [Mycobacterium sherrisii]MEC4763291.1 hypothetical protein [Mycobacterium sherrisii]ODR05706.1 hypothetical protein BHQ21_13535 [Mycobacterium sherrisii]ORW76988.1 hypothetical protein AWC25_10715 [Mycobacterium sherrisii]
MTAHANRHGALRVVGMVVGVMIAPVFAPTLIWATIAVDLPLAVVIFQLLTLAAISNTLAHSLIRNYPPGEDGVGQAMSDKSWSSEPASG